jgi:heat shock protein 1/8
LQATRDAGLIADLDVTRILNEPTAAALAFGVLESADGVQEGEDGGGGGKCSNMLVFDFGGGTLDVTIMEIQGQSFKVKSTDGDMRLGGEDIDALLVAHFVKVCKATTGVDLEGLDEGKKKCKAYKRLYSACSRLKVDLSRTSESDFTIDDLVDGVCFEASMDRPSFDSIVSPLLERIRIPIDRALQKVTNIGD